MSILYVGIAGKDMDFFELDFGWNSMWKFAELLREGKIEAIKIEREWGFNADVTITGESALKLIAAEYPNKLAEAKRLLKPKEQYTLVSVDLS